MKLITFLLCSLLSFSTLAAELKGEYAQRDNYYPRVKFETSMGDIIVELNRIRAEITVNNFLTYVINREYDNTVIHRVEKDFVVQGGGYNLKYEDLKSKAPIFNESGNGLKNEVGTIAMARETSPHTATRQFFFNLNDNKSLDPGRRWGYAVFGNIIEGEEVLEKIGAVEIAFHEKTGWPTAPVTDVIIKKVTLIPAEN